MNRKTKNLIEGHWWNFLSVYSLIIFIICLQSVSGQNVTESKMEQDNSILRKETKNFDNENETKYKLIYLTVSEGKSSYSLKEKVELHKIRNLNFNFFSESLSKAGADGYKVVTALPMYMVAIVKADEEKYEYDLFELEGSHFFIKTGLREKLENTSYNGYRIIDHTTLDSVCEFTDSENAAMGENCEYTDRFLIEKVAGSKKSVEQVLINIFPGWGVKPSFELEKQLAEKLAEGFYPALILSKFEILLNKVTDQTEFSDDKPDVQIVRSSWKDVKTKTKELAQKGYRLAMTQFGISILYRNRETTQNPVEYIWVNTKKNDFEKEIIKLQKQGALYKMTYPSQRGDENTLIFERKLKDNGERREYKILKFEFTSRWNPEKTKEYVELTKSSRNNLNTMNNLINEGFEVRDLFYSDKVSVILEKKQ